MFAPSERFVEIGYVEDKIVLPNSGSPFSQPVIVNRFFPVKKDTQIIDTEILYFSRIKGIGQCDVLQTNKGTALQTFETSVTTKVCRRIFIARTFFCPIGYIHIVRIGSTATTTSKESRGIFTYIISISSKRASKHKI